MQKAISRHRFTISMPTIGSLFPSPSPFPIPSITISVRRFIIIFRCQEYGSRPASWVLLGGWIAAITSIKTAKHRSCLPGIGYMLPTLRSSRKPTMRFTTSYMRCWMCMVCITNATVKTLSATLLFAHGTAICRRNTGISIPKTVRFGSTSRLSILVSG